MKLELEPGGIRRWSGFATGVVVCGIVWVVLSPRGGRTPLPSRVAREVEQHAEASAIDTMEIHRLKRVADSAKAKERVAIASAYLPATGSIDQVRDLTIADAQKDTALAWAQLEVASLDSALARSEARATRGDTVISAVVKVAETREEPCRVLWVLPCPTRMVVMVGTAVVVAVGVGRR